jgi:Kef-type K+ transport system membrane component KefB
LVVLTRFVGVIVLLGWGLRCAAAWRPGQSVATRLDLTTAQMSTRSAVMVVLGAATIAAVCCFEGILGAFLAGLVSAVLFPALSQSLLARRAAKAGDTELSDLSAPSV